MTRPLVRDQGGFALPELLTATWIAVVVSLATFSLIEFVMKRSGEVEARVDATQRARLTMDTVTRQLRSQVCLSSTVPPIEDGDANQVTFYTDLSQSAPGTPPERHVLTFDPAARTIVEETWIGQGAPPATVYQAAPDRVRTIANNVERDGATPVFQYFRFGTTKPPRPDVALTPPLRANGTEDLVALIRVSFVTLPTRATARDGKAVPLTDDVYVRPADPEDPAPIPTCA